VGEGEQVKGKQGNWLRARNSIQDTFSAPRPKSTSRAHLLISFDLRPMSEIPVLIGQGNFLDLRGRTPHRTPQTSIPTQTRARCGKYDFAPGRDCLPQLRALITDKELHGTTVQAHIGCQTDRAHTGTRRIDLQTVSKSLLGHPPCARGIGWRHLVPPGRPAPRLPFAYENLVSLLPTDRHQPITTKNSLAQPGFGAGQPQS